MKLTSLNIKGFKSFGNETTIHFNDEIIGIVGPNGSGKSNVVDAIRWVLGEQKSKELRLDKMVDVIFNGTKSKRKASMAQVTMTFENSKKLIPVEYDTVSVSRILYDTNDSEYRINNVPCRLKDIRNLFLDTGIGSNSYAIIELGMVDDILMDKDHARRKMFEQGAGIAKYKVRKKETMNKLKNTQNDLDRVEDILFELQLNLKSLEKQAKRTKKYYELKEEYKEISIQRAAISQKEALIKEKQYKSEMLEANQKFNDISSQIHTLEADLEKIKKSNLDSEKMLSNKQKEFNSIVEEIRKKENLQEIKKQNLSFINQNIKRAESNQIEFRSSIEEISTALSGLNDQINNKGQATAEIKEQFDEWKVKFQDIEEERKRIQGENSSELEMLKDLENRRFGIEKSLIELKSKVDNAQQNKASVEEEMQRLERQKSTFNEDFSAVNENVKTAEKDLESLTYKLSHLEEEKQKVNVAITEQKDHLIIANRKLDALRNEHNLLKDMIDNLEGFPESAKFLAKKWDKPKPLLSDIIECDEAYRTTIEAFLDPYLSYFVLDTVDEARASIELLKKAQKGKSQFFILSSFDDKESLSINLSQFGKAAINVVKSDQKYQALLHHLLKNVVIVDDEALFVNALPDDNLTYLSTSGASNRTKHIVAGGSVGLFDGKRIGRQKEIDKLKKQITSTEEEIEKINNNISNLSNKLKTLVTDEIESSIYKKRSSLRELELKRAEVQTKVNSIQNSFEGMANRIEQFDQTIVNDSSQISVFEKEIVTLLSQIEEKNELIKNQTGMIDHITQNYGEINSKYNEAQLKWVRHQNEIQTLRNELQFRSQQKEELESKTISTVEEITKLRASVIENEQLIEELKQELYGDYKVKEEKQKELNATEQNFFANRSVVTEKEDKLRDLNRKMQRQQLIINDIKDKLTGIEFELRSALERLKIEFNIDLKSLNVEVEEDPEKIEQLLHRYEKIKKRLDNYGEINPMAMEAYDEMLGRFESMESQRNDILEARDSLEETIKEIDGEATKMFLDSFYKVKENFKEVFRSLFSSEDDCDLVLFNPESPLESDIEIVAKPKGKRPKVLSQLSGGEKTLTATALLFSLYLLKPAPFCIFDEVDAPLDDINIQKFSRLIRQFADASQFIIITHNKSTMAAMDKLYGVYMQEQGVSGVTQVDFRDYEHDEKFRTVNI